MNVPRGLITMTIGCILLISITRDPLWLNIGSWFVLAAAAFAASERR